MKILISFVGAIILAFIIGLLITFFLVPLLKVNPDSLVLQSEVE